MKVMISGANGFIGRALCFHLLSRGFLVTPAVRRSTGIRGECVIGDGQSWRSALEGCASVVHLAGLVYTAVGGDQNSLETYRTANVHVTSLLARQAVEAGVRRFVFVSTIKVNGEETLLGRPFRSDDPVNPQCPYAISKWEAESELLEIGIKTGLEVVIIRPTIVYGPNVKANFELFIRLLARGVPLPFASVTENRRSLVALDNLVDLIYTCLHHSAAVNETFLVSDGEDLSTAELLRRLGVAMRRPARLFYVPPRLIEIAAYGLNKTGISRKLFGSLQVDISKTEQLLGWTPPISVEEGLRRAIACVPN